MIDREARCSRRKFLASAAALGLAGAPGGEGRAEQPQLGRARPGKPATDGRRPIAVVTTVYRPLSHAYHIAGRFLHGYQRGGSLHVPRHHVRAMHVEQMPENDLSRDLARDFGFRHADTVKDALVENGKLAVEGVLLIGEHGNYPRNEKGQILYPRFELFGQIVSCFRMTGQVCPVFNDKHLSYDWSKAKQMAAWAKELSFPFMAGSSLPVTWRRPELEPALETPFEDALVAAYGGVEIYGCHVLETLQVMLERRKGGETGVKAVTCLTGKEVWKAGDAGLWSWDLLDAALARAETINPGDVRRNTGSFGIQGQPPTPATAFLVEYRDGTRGTALLLNGHIRDFVFAGRVRGEEKPVSCRFVLPEPPGARYFDAQVAAIEKMLETGRPTYPVERTVLTTGMLAYAMDSHHRRGARIETPDLDVCYSPPADSGFIRGPIAAE
jgi:hypothetical protein